MRSEDDTLEELWARGAHRLKRVTFRANRSTIWSLTRNATVLNLHEAYREAPPEILDALATIARGLGRRTAAVRRASEAVCDWPPLAHALDGARALHAEQLRAAMGAAGESSRCCGTAEQRSYLRALYRYLNQTRFAGRLPDDVPVRLSDRMSSALGHMLPGEREGSRYVAEIALNVELLLEGNGAERVDTLLHEMAHAADYLFDGNHGHGRSWRSWAARVGCRAQTQHDRPLPRRRRKGQKVRRVPPMPSALAHLAA